MSAPDDAFVPADASPNAFGKIEVYGIDIIRDEHRHGTPRDLFWPWFGANSTFINMIAGGVLILLGLSLWQGLLAVFLGSLVFALVGLCSLPGPSAGTATLAISRAAFGLRGNLVPTLFSWATTLGWETINIILGTFAIRTLLDQLGLSTPHWMLAPFLVIMAVLTFAIPLLGHATLVVAQKWLSYLLTVLTLVMAVLLIGKVHWDYQPGPLAASNTLATWFLGLTAVLGAGAMSWVNYAADYSRYLPADADRKAIIGWITLATVIPGWLYGGLGVVLGTLVDTSNPIATLPNILPNWFLFPFLVVIIAGVVANNVMNSYSSGLNLLALGIRIERYKSVFVDGVITVAAACIALFVYDFSTVFVQFLSLLVILLAPWAGIFLVDYHRRRGRYNTADLMRDRGGAYWYRNGVNWPGLIALGTGIVAGGLVANTAKWQGFVSIDYLGGADLSPIVGLLVGGGLYLAFTRAPVIADAPVVPVGTGIDA
jgi:NCS1 family nucleobase:cation symporter-1